MIIMLVLIAALIVLDIAAIRLGTDSRERLDSKEWEYRWQQAISY